MSVLFTAVDTEPREHSEHSWFLINTMNIKCGVAMWSGVVEK